MALDANGTTPAPAATLPNGEKGQPKPAAVGAPGNGNANQNTGTVTITTKEYGELQRAKARTLSFDRRSQFNRSPNSAPAPKTNPQGDEAAQAIAQSQSETDEANRRALQAEVRNGVRDILEKSEYANLPKSTRDLILKNPAMLSEADNLEEALLDIEDFVSEQIAAIGDGGNNVTVASGTRPAPQENHEVPPVHSSGPAPVKGDEMEDISKLTGNAKSRAIIRNSLRKAKNGTQ